MENFEEYLIKKYPDLFYKKEDGSLECPCGAWVPEGWETIIDELCGAITRYATGSYRSERVITSKKYYLWDACFKVPTWFHKKFIKWFPKYNKWELNKPFYNFVEKFRERSHKYISFKKIYVPAVKIDQIKSKFSDLRFYYSGGDAQVSGMVMFAEHLCSKTCENTGDAGVKCTNGGWYATLSPKEAERLGYKHNNISKEDYNSGLDTAASIVEEVIGGTPEGETILCGIESSKKNINK